MTKLTPTAMTDNNPRPEPMSREQVLAVLDNWLGNRNVERNKAIAAVAALYELCEALERRAIDAERAYYEHFYAGGAARSKV